MERIILTEEDENIIDRRIENSLQKIKNGIKEYCQIMGNINPDDKLFRTRFNHFFRMMKRSQDLYNAFYNAFKDFLPPSKTPSYIEILKRLREKMPIGTGQIEQSFASKMLHTIDPTKPIWDKIVVKKQLKIKIPSYTKLAEKRLLVIEKKYKHICDGYKSFISNADKAQYLIEKFNKIYDSLLEDDSFSKIEITSIKKIDFILWACGEESVLSQEERNLFKSDEEKE